MKSLWTLLVLFALLITCGTMAPNDTASTGGTGSEVVGVVNYPDSSNAVKKMGKASMLNPFKFAGVYIHPRNYFAETDLVKDNPVSYTESNGFFKISNVLPGEHTIYVKDNTGMAIAIGVTVPEDSTTIDLGPRIAQKTASARVQYQGQMTGNVLFYVSIRGTGITIRCTERNIYALIGDIPTGLESNVVTIRMVQPFNKGMDITVPKFQPAQLFTIDPFGDF
jgi:hypothetical protein